MKMHFAVQPKAFGSFDASGCDWATDLDNARDIALDWSAEQGGEPMIVWRLTSGNAVAWIEVVA